MEPHLPPPHPLSGVGRGIPYIVFCRLGRIKNQIQKKFLQKLFQTVIFCPSDPRQVIPAGAIGTLFATRSKLLK